MLRSIMAYVESSGVCTESPDILILETFTDYDTKKLRIRMAHWVDHYSALGWSMAREYRGLRYKLRTYVGEDFNVYVEARSQSNTRTVLGVFPDVPKADRFVQEYYPNGVLETFVFARNTLTAEYYGAVDSETKERKRLSQLVKLRKDRRLLRSK